MFVKKTKKWGYFLRKLLLLILSLLLITTLTGCGTTKTSATTPDSTPKTAEDKKLMEEIKQHENLTDADMKKIQAEAEERMNKFVGQDYSKNIKEDKPDFYTMKSK